MTLVIKKEIVVLFFRVLLNPGIMKSKNILILLLAGMVIGLCWNCGSADGESASASDDRTEAGAGQSAVADDESQKNIVQVAVSSPDHTTLVTAIKAVNYTDVLVNAGPFTVFAPTNAAFDKLPAGTVENLLKAENKASLEDILEYHVAIGVYKAEALRDGQVLGMANSKNVTFKVNGDEILINNARVVASIPVSNGLIHVIDEVLLPQ
jgi:uncharacterized surface protein with fasciclin (FAS1) repeats